MKRHDSTFAVASSVLTFLSFPNFNLSWLAWVALVPLILAVRDASPRQAFLTGWLTGTLAYSGILYWLITTFHAARESPLLAVVCLILLAGYLGLFWGIWSCCVARCRQPIVVAAAWVALEYLRTYLFSGFPWALLGDSQFQHLALIQTASVTGVYGISFLIVLVNTSWVTSRRAIAISLALLCGVIGLGAYRLHQAKRTDLPPTYRVALLQGSIDQYKKWDDSYVEEIKHVYEKLSAQAALQKPDLIVWPETSVPGYLLQDPPLRDWLFGVVRQSGTTHLIGAPAQEGSDIYNAAFLISKDGRVEGGYAKKHLVPFGEIVPFGSILNRWIHALNELGGFTPGQWPAVLTYGSARIGVNICYEAIFPNLVRRSVAQGATLIVNVTNDGWYMKTSEPYQHLVPNIFRAVENARWLIRADNTGISAIIDPYGRLVATSSIYEDPIVISGMIQPRADLTLYTRVGDLFAWLCILIACGGIVLHSRRIHE